MFKKLFTAAVLLASLVPAEVQARQCGVASWYGPGLYGNQTANGEIFKPGTMTAAHPYITLGSRVRVTNLDNGLSAVVRVNDRGPYVGNRVIDLAHGAARVLGVIGPGLANVCVSRL